MEKRDLEHTSAAWNLSTKRPTNDSSRSESFGSSSEFEKPKSHTSSSFSGSTYNSSGSSSGWKQEHEKSFQMSQEPHSSHPIDQDIAPRFSGMNFGDVMRITVMKEMDQLKMTKDQPLDLSNKSWKKSL
eukprot:TRINITY_DN20418_c0_g1_i1.p1 TRINITY_DN20418_c0_g1~~TRINITY_DN20418_c0_g1_i1.p1  ORF type:complete len:129 (-),score=28.29 TRINITY_DN20418_c0_g1_i1:72-458(-)